MAVCLIKTKEIDRIVSVVKDLEKTMENWLAYVEFDTDSIKYYRKDRNKKDGIEVRGSYKGEEICYRVKAARFNFGGVEFMLVEPLNREGGDPYSDFLRAYGNGFHHICVGVESLENTLQRLKTLNLEPWVESDWDGERQVMFDLRSAMGSVLEFTERGSITPGTHGAEREPNIAAMDTANVKLKLDLVCQVAFVVRDLDLTVHNLQTLVGGSEINTNCEASNEIAEGNLSPQIYNGVEGVYAYRQQNLSWGGMDIEVFQPINDQRPNPMNDFLDQQGPGIHHINVRLANRQEGLDFLRGELGVVPLMECWNHGRHCVYMDLREQLGLIVEIGSRVVGPKAVMVQGA